MQFDNDVVVIKAEDPTHYLDDFRETVGSLFENRNIIADFPRYDLDKTFLSNLCFKGFPASCHYLPCTPSASPRHCTGHPGCEYQVK